MSFRNRTSCGFPRLITSKLFDELQAIAVRVEDVEEADLVVDLEHGSDLDTLGAKPLRLRLGVVDVDRRHPRLFGLSLSERDLHAGPLEVGPALVLVEVRLGEAQLVGVEGTRGRQVTNAVPDAHARSLEREPRFFEQRA